MSLKIYAVGDIMLGEQPLCNNFGVSSVIKRRDTDYSKVFEYRWIKFG